MMMGVNATIILEYVGLEVISERVYEIVDDDGVEGTFNGVTCPPVPLW